MPDIEFNEEKRFAVVMYGGVSLAIYMNGVAQELYNLVRATSRHVKEPKGSAKVYRDIANDLKAKFVIDILSGTSAGGINAVFLAKALANGQTFEGLESLWVNTANIDGLINDRRGLGVAKALRFVRDVLSPSALLNGNKMYMELVDALDGMEGKNEDAPEMEEIDLFVTATDLEGRIMPVEILGEQVNEREHRHVFHLRKALAAGGQEPTNHFTADYNPFIAFAARCTSSFPVAFEPVQLKNLAATNDRWREFFGSIPSSQSGAGSDDFGARVFADGGYLDNKPFSYAIQTIMVRHSDAPVDRKLIYIEPSPEMLQAQQSGGQKDLVEPPNALENAFKAFTLARHQTIRRDLEVLRKRNRLLERTNRILKGTEDDIAHLDRKNQPPKILDWKKKSLRQMVDEQGFGYGGYLRFRVARLTDEIAEIICRQAGIDPESDGFLAVRDLVRVWRDRTYAYYATRGGSKRRGGKESKGYSSFILDYDFGFHYRRLGFVLSIIDRLLIGGADAETILEARGLHGRPGSDPEYFTLLKNLRTTVGGHRRAILLLRQSLLDVSGTASLRLREAVAGLGLNPGTLVHDLQTSSTDEACREKARLFLEHEGRAEALNLVLRLVRDQVARANAVMKGCKRELGLPEHTASAVWDGKPPQAWGLRARWVVQFYFRFFGHYDAVAFPYLQNTSIGEELDEVEIVRISPRDPSRLGGTKYGNFGAFFDEIWRNNDILRGRLDGAGAIIRCLYPDDADAEKRRNHTDAVEEAIVQEWITRYVEKQDFLTEVMTGSTQAKRETSRVALSRLAWFGSAQSVREEVRKILEGRLGAKDFLSRFKSYTVNSSPSPELMVRAITRLVHVFGKMLTGIAQNRGNARGEAISRLVAQAGAIAVGMVEVFLPGSWRELLTRRILQVLMVFGVLMIAASIYLPASGLGQLGTLLFGGALFLELLRLAIGHFLRTGSLTRLLLFLLAVVGSALAVNGVIYAPQALRDLLQWFKNMMN